MSYTDSKGFTIIELSITLLISSVITLGLMNLFIANTKVHSMTQGSLESQESGRLTLNFLKTRIHQAGYNHGNYPIPAFYPSCNQAEQHCTYDSNTEMGDRLAIHRLLDNQMTCAETHIALQHSKLVVDNYWIEFNKKNNSHTLYCQTYDAFSGEPIYVTKNSQMKKQPLTDGVIAMHFLYGISENNQYPNLITRYLSAADLNAEYPSNNLSIWQSIKAIRIALLTESLSLDASKSDVISYHLLDADPMIFSDGKSRSLFSTTVALMK